MKRRWKHAAIGLSLIAAVMATAVLGNTESRHFLFFSLSPGYAKKITFMKLEQDGREIYILGTIHGRHLGNEKYSLWHLEAVIVNLRPGLLLVESRPEELAAGNWGDGPVEMLFAGLTAIYEGIAVDGMDWWDRETLLTGRTHDLREEKMAEHILDRAAGHETILVLAGFSHVPGLARRLKDAGYAAAPFGTPEKERLFALSGGEGAFPPGMSYYTHRRIALDNAALAGESNARLERAYRESIALRRSLLEMIKSAGEKTIPPRQWA